MRWFPLIAFLVTISTQARGDTILLKTGGKLEGTVLEDESTPARVVILTRTGKHSAPRSSIEFIQSRKDNQVKTYKEHLAEAPDTAQGQYDLAVWCQKHQYRKEAQVHLRKALIHDPDHQGARSKLGYKRVGEEWKTEDEIYAGQGLVKDARGKWVLPQEKEEAERKEAQKKKRAEYFSRIRMLTRMMFSENQTKAENAAAQLATIRDSAAIEPLMKYMSGADVPVQFRTMLVGILAEIVDGESTRELLRLAVEDPSEEVRDQATQTLLPRKSAELTKAAVGYLKDKENAKVNTAATLIAELDDTNALPHLVDALTTKHTYVHRTTMEEAFAPPGARIEGFTPIQQPDGSIALIPNSGAPLMPGPLVQDSIPKKRIIKVTHQNAKVLDALTKMTEEDFGYDKKRWLDWLKTHSVDKAARAIGNG